MQQGYGGSGIITYIKTKEVNGKEIAEKAEFKNRRGVLFGRSSEGEDLTYSYS
ncbi:hypothetical protein [Candidatus Pyrohabitans sp.]